MCPDGWKHECTGNIVRAHSLSRRSALRAVTESGHVFSFTPDWARLFHKDQFVFKSKSAREASTFTGFCGHHDREIFAPLDRRDFDGSQELTILSAYRTLCREVFLKKAHMRAIKFAKTLDRGRSNHEQHSIQEVTSAAFSGAESALSELNNIRSQFETALKTSSCQAFAYCNFHFPERPRIVSAGGFNPSHDLSGNFLQDLDKLETYSQNVFLSILPDTAGFWASFVWPGSYSLMERFVEDIGKNYCTVGGVYAVALAHIENTFLRPSYWKGSSERTKERLHFLAMMDLMHRDYARVTEEAKELKARHPTQADLVLRG